MDTVRLGFFLGELYGLSCCACDIGNAFLYGKTKEKVYITAGPKIGTTLCGKNLIINKSLYGVEDFCSKISSTFSRIITQIRIQRIQKD
jgi:hypothetical protein